MRRLLLRNVSSPTSTLTSPDLVLTTVPPQLPTAALRAWAGEQADGGSLEQTMSEIMQLRLPLDTRLVAVLPAAGLTMLVCERRIDGVGPDGALVRLRGVGCTVVRPQRDGSWRIAADD